MQRVFDFAENPREALCPLLLAGPIHDQVLPDFNSGVHKAAFLCVNRDGVVRGVIDRIRLVVADDKIAFRAQCIAQQ